jgi:hypothetical protein
VNGKWVRLALVVALIASASLFTAGEAAAAPPACTVVLPHAGDVLTGPVTLDADAPNASTVEFYLNGAYLGPAYAAPPFGWLYSPDNKQTWQWNVHSHVTIPESRLAGPGSPTRV